jgi:hypothetical protein
MLKSLDHHLRFLDFSRGQSGFKGDDFGLLRRTNPLIKNKQKIVQIASTAIPATISQNATRWTEEEYLGRSNIIPAPTAMLASTAKDNSETCGQNGSKSPEINLLTYVSIAALAGWLVAGGLATAALLKSLYALWREHHPRSR